MYDGVKGEGTAKGLCKKLRVVGRCVVTLSRKAADSHYVLFSRTKGVIAVTRGRFARVCPRPN